MMQIDQSRLRAICADASAANAAVLKASAEVRRLRMELSSVRARMDPVVSEDGRGVDPAVRTKLAEEEKAILADIKAAEDAHDDAQERWTLAGRIASKCREYASNLGALPSDLENLN